MNCAKFLKTQITAYVASKEFCKIFSIFFSKEISTTTFRLDNLVKRMIFCYPRDIVGEFPLECKNDNNNNNDNNDGKIKKLPCLRSCRQINVFVSAEVCKI